MRWTAPSGASSEQAMASPTRTSSPQKVARSVLTFLMTGVYGEGREVGRLESGHRPSAFGPPQLRSGTNSNNKRPTPMAQPPNLPTSRCVIFLRMTFEEMCALAVSRKADMPGGSSTTELLAGGVDAIGKKLVEE